MVSHPNLATALAAFQGEMPTVPKAKHADTGKYGYSYADLAGIVALAAPVLAKHGLAFTTRPRHTEHGWELRGALLHESGEKITGELPIRGDNPQALGSAISYMRRYLLGCLTGIVTDDDDDGGAATIKKGAAKAPAAAPEPEGGTRRMSRKPAETGEQIAPGQRAAIFAAMRGAGFGSDAKTPEGKQVRLDYLSRATGRPVESTNDLTAREAHVVLDMLRADSEGNS